MSRRGLVGTHVAQNLLDFPGQTEIHHHPATTGRLEMTSPGPQQPVEVGP